MNKRLVIAGGGHVHMVTLAKLHTFVDKGHAVTVIGPSDHHFYSGMGPGMLGGTYRPEEIRFATRHVVEKQGGAFIRAKVVGIDPAEKRVHLDTGATVPYDVLSCNLGSQVPETVVTGPLEDIYLVKPIERLLAARQRVLALGAGKKITIGVIGGGPSAVEISGNLWRLTRTPGMHPATIQILTSKTLLPHHPPGVRRKALVSLTKRGIDIVEHCDVQKIQTGRVTDLSGKVYDLDIIFVAVGVKPSPVFAASGIPIGPDGGMRVNRHLQSVAHPDIFGGGDCIYFEDAPLDKVGVYAVRQNPVIYHNLMATLEGGPLQGFDPGGKYLLIFNLGDGTGIFYKWSLLFGGRPAFLFKDYLDRRFMSEFQAIE
ncbi:MAG: FAD-dependent oxidoreductase [Pseudomonadota bacterium]